MNARVQGPSFAFSSMITVCVFFGCATAPVSVADKATDEAAVAARSHKPPSEGGVTWRVIDPFRLLQSDDSPTDEVDTTDKLFEHFATYYLHVFQHRDMTSVPRTHWNRADRDYDHDYLTVKTWTVSLSFDKAKDGDKCRWTIDNASLSETGCKNVRHVFCDRDTEVSVEVDSSRSATITVHPRDVLIATLGDSYAAGEGVPDVDANGFADAQWMDHNCHRSLFAGPSVAALLYTRLNPHVSVTHLTYACSGATVLTDPKANALNGGVLSSYKGVATMDYGDDRASQPSDPPKSNPPQVELLKQTIIKSGRMPDFVTVSAGGNDLGFAALVEAAAIHHDDLEGIVSSQFLRNLPSTAVGLRLMATELKSFFDDHKVLGDEPSLIFTGYPNPAKFSDGADCVDSGESFTGLPRCPLFSPWAQVGTEQEKILTLQVIPLLALLPVDAAAASASQHRSVVVTPDFTNHAFCGCKKDDKDESNKCKNPRWLNTVRDSCDRIAGTVGNWLCYFSGEGKLGSMHPNIEGQTAIADAILNQIVDDECKGKAAGAGFCSAAGGWRCDPSLRPVYDACHVFNPIDKSTSTRRGGLRTSPYALPPQG